MPGAAARGCPGAGRLHGWSPSGRSGRIRASGATIQILDSTTSLFAGALILGELAVVMGFYYLTQETYRGFRDWLVAVAGQAVGLALLISMPAGRPPVLALLFANVLLVATIDRLYRGTARFAGSPGRFTAAEMVFYTVALAAYLHFLIADYRVSARVGVVGLCMAFVAARTGGEALRLARGPYRSVAWFLVATQVAGAFIHLARVGVALGGAAPLELLRRGGSDAALLTALVAYGVATVLGLLMLSARRTRLELEEARAQVLTLEGIIPICMYCHKVRNDLEAWDRIETYISRHTTARLSHGICPDCYQRHHPVPPASGD